MTDQTTYLLQVFEKIGTPLMTAILDATRGQPESDNLSEHAQKMAELLTKTIEASVELGQTIEISKLGEDSDAVRLALAALLGPMVAQAYKNNRRIPDQNEIKKITQGLNSILSFSSNFKPTDAHEARLEHLQAAGQNVDGPQMALQHIQAFGPVLQAVTSFSFGQPEQKLMIEITNKLSAKATEIRTGAFGALDEKAQKRVDLALVTALAKLYQTCHEEQVQALSQMSEDEQAKGLSMENLWQKFDQRAALIQVLAQNMLPGDTASEASTSSGKAPSPATTPPEPPPTTEAATPHVIPPAAPETPPPPPPPPTQPAEQQDGGYNPMSMFSAKPAAEPPANPAPPPPQENPPPATPEPPPAPPSEPSAPPPEDKKEEEAHPASSSANPMSFFKSGEKSEE